jgi:hypothetical protein
LVSSLSINSIPLFNDARTDHPPDRAQRRRATPAQRLDLEFIRMSQAPFVRSLPYAGRRYCQVWEWPSLIPVSVVDGGVVEG